MKTLPVWSILLVTNLVAVIKKVHQDNLKTKLNTFIASVSFLFIVMTIVTLSAK